MAYPIQLSDSADFAPFLWDNDASLSAAAVYARHGEKGAGSAPFSPDSHPTHEYGLSDGIIILREVPPAAPSVKGYTVEDAYWHSPEWIKACRLAQFTHAD